MAQTLRWPRALKKEIEMTQTAAKRNPNWPQVYVSTGLLGVFSALVAIFCANSSIAVFVFLCWVFVTFLVIYGYMIFTSQPGTGKVMKGLEGELAVAYMLDRLPEGWFVINDITIYGRQIDHIVIGPAGIFCLETKNWNTAGCDENGCWYRLHMGNWVPVKQNPAEQNSFHVGALRKLVKERLGLKTKVGSIIVLANPNGKYRIKSRLISPEDTLICLPGDLNQLFEGHEEIILSPDKASDVARVIITDPGKCKGEKFGDSGIIVEDGEMPMGPDKQ